MFSRGLLIMSFTGLLVLFAGGILIPDSPIMWLASTTAPYAFLRLALMAVVIALFVTTPPRHKTLRVLVGIVSISVAGWATIQTYGNQMQLLDTLMILETCIVAGIMALEQTTEELESKIRPEARPAVNWFKTQIASIDGRPTI